MANSRAPLIGDLKSLDRVDPGSFLVTGWAAAHHCACPGVAGVVA
jgi:hypothetical protein